MLSASAGIRRTVRADREIYRPFASGGESWCLVRRSNISLECRIWHLARINTIRAGPPMAETSEPPAHGAVAEQLASQHPLWALVLLLGEIATRVQNLPAEEELLTAARPDQVGDEVPG